MEYSSDLLLPVLQDSFWPCPLQPLTCSNSSILKVRLLAQLSLMFQAQIQDLIPNNVTMDWPVYDDGD
jgi:hypothetical protein